MCLIIDVNIAHKVLFEDKDPDLDFQDVRRGLFPGRNAYITMAYGGKLAEEYYVSEILRRRLRILDQAGRTRKVDEQQIESELAWVVETGLCQSNDEHIIALARAGNVRLLCSEDRHLWADFHDKRLLDEPRGKVYRNASHKDLLRQFCKGAR